MSLQPEISLAAREWLLDWLAAYLAEYQGDELQAKTDPTQAARLYGQFGGGTLTGRQSNLTARPGQPLTTASLNGVRYAVGDTKKQYTRPFGLPKNSPVVVVAPLPYQPVALLAVAQVLVDGLPGPVAVPREGSSEARYPFLPELETLLASGNVKPGGAPLQWAERRSIGLPYPLPAAYQSGRESIVNESGNDQGERYAVGHEQYVWRGAQSDNFGQLVLPVNRDPDGYRTLYVKEYDPVESFELPSFSFEPLSFGVFAGNFDDMAARPFGPVLSAGGGTFALDKKPNGQSVSRWTPSSIEALGLLTDSGQSRGVYQSLQAAQEINYSVTINYGDGVGPEALERPEYTYPEVVVLNPDASGAGTRLKISGIPADALQPGQILGFITDGTGGGESQGYILEGAPQVIRGAPQTGPQEAVVTVDRPLKPSGVLGYLANDLRARQAKLRDNSDGTADFQIGPTEFRFREYLQVEYQQLPELFVEIAGDSYRVYYRNIWSAAVTRDLNEASYLRDDGRWFAFARNRLVSQVAANNSTGQIPLGRGWSYRAESFVPPVKTFDKTQFYEVQNAVFSGIPALDGRNYSYFYQGDVVDTPDGYALYVRTTVNAVAPHNYTPTEAEAEARSQGLMVPYFDDALLQNRVTPGVSFGAGDYDSSTLPSQASEAYYYTQGDNDSFALELHNTSVRAETYRLNVEKPEGWGWSFYDDPSFSGVPGEVVTEVTLGPGEGRCLVGGLGIPNGAAFEIAPVVVSATALSDESIVSSFTFIVYVEGDESLFGPLRSMNRWLYREPGGYDNDTGEPLTGGVNRLANPQGPDRETSIWYGLEWNSAAYVCDAFRADMPDADGNLTEHLYAVAIVNDDSYKVLLSVDGVQVGEWDLLAFFPGAEDTLTFLNGEVWNGKLRQQYHFLGADWPYHGAAYLSPFTARVRTREDKTGPVDCPVAIYLESFNDAEL